MKKFLFFILSILSCVEATESSLYYTKIGGATLPGEGKSLTPLPTLGLGGRWQKNHQGIDLSVSLTSLAVFNYFQFKSLFVLYPFPEHKNLLYCGIGPSIGLEATSVPIGQPFGSAFAFSSLLALEGCIGYEFRHVSHFTTFMQIELSHPMIGEMSPSIPSVGISFGMGF